MRSAEPLDSPSPDDFASYTPNQREHYYSVLALEATATAHHEAGHVIGALLAGRRIAYAQVGRQPHVSLAPLQPGAPWTEDADMLLTLGGPVAEQLARHRLRSPDPREIRYHLEKARALRQVDAEDTPCDGCHSASCLLAHHPTADDDELMERWRGHWDRTLGVFDQRHVRLRVGLLADVLQRHIMLVGREIPAT